MRYQIPGKPCIVGAGDDLLIVLKELYLKARKNASDFDGGLHTYQQSDFEF